MVKRFYQSILYSFRPCTRRFYTYNLILFLLDQSPFGKKALLTGQPSDAAAMLTRAEYDHNTRQATPLRRPRAEYDHNKRQATLLKRPGTISNYATRRFSCVTSDLFNRLPPDVCYFE